MNIPAIMLKKSNFKFIKIKVVCVVVYDCNKNMYLLLVMLKIYF